MNYHERVIRRGIVKDIVIIYYLICLFLGDQTLSFLRYSPIIVKLTVCFNTFRMAES